jgi:hypothetical protein
VLHVDFVLHGRLLALKDGLPGYMDWRAYVHGMAAT